MSNAFTLWAELKADTGAFDRAMRGSEHKAEELRKEIEKTEVSAKGFGQTSATTSRQFERLNAVLNSNKQKLNDAAAAFSRGDISAKRMANTFLQVERSSAAASNRLRDMHARMKDLQSVGASKSLFKNNDFFAGITGGLVGAGAAVAGLAAFGVGSRLAGGMFELGKQSVQLAADFQMSQNAMAVFTGSSEKAKIELAALADLSRKTPGLGLLDAEQGALRLRAMGFQAATVTDLLTGLAKQKILSGVGSEAIDRVTLNLAQLASGGGDFQDIKDLVQNLPTARKEINEAFGSLQGFQSALKADPQSAIKRFAEELSGVQAPASGFNDAIQKLNDSFIVTGRVFGEPALEPLSLAVKDLTSFLLSNSDTWSAWGKNVADAISTAKMNWDDLRFGDSKAAPKGGAVDNLGQVGWKTLFMGWNAIGEGLTRDGRLAREAAEAAEKKFKESFPKFQDGMIRDNFTVDMAKLTGGSGAIPNNGINLEKMKQDAHEMIRLQSEARKENSRWFTDAYSKLLDRGNFGVGNLRNLMGEIGRNTYIDPESKGNLFHAYQKQIDSLVKAGIDKATELGKGWDNALRQTIQGYGSTNPFVKILGDADLAMRALRENTRGLGGDMQGTLARMQQLANARAVFQQTIGNKVDAFGLSDTARQFRQGYLDKDTNENFQKRISGVLNAIGVTGMTSSMFNILSDGSLQAINDPMAAIKKTVQDAAVVSALQGVDPARLTGSQRAIGANAFSSEAARLAGQKGEAERLMTLQVEGQERIEKSVSELVKLAKQGGLAAIDLTIKDENNRTTLGGSSGNVNARYR